MSGARGYGIARAAWAAALAAIAVSMLLPSVIVAVLSFSGDEFIKFPPRTFGLRQYAALLSAREWREPFVRSVLVAAAASPAAVLVGLAAVVGLHRTAIRGKTVLQFLGIGPALMPGVAYAVALYSLFGWLGLLGTARSIVVAHVALSVPFVILITGAAISRVPRDLELAAMSLGAERWAALRDVTLPLIVPAILASFIFAFVHSFDDTVVTSFLSGVGFETLPVAIFNSVREGVEPVITAIATLLTVATALLLAAHTFMRRTR